MSPKRIAARRTPHAARSAVRRTPPVAPYAARRTPPVAPYAAIRTPPVAPYAAIRTPHQEPHGEGPHGFEGMVYPCVASRWPDIAYAIAGMSPTPVASIQLL